MERLIIIAMIILLSGCGSTPIKFTTEVKEIYVPVIYSPAPPVIERPELPIHQMSEEELKQDGIVAKYYKATVKALIGYSRELEKALAGFDKINKTYEEERKRKEVENTQQEK